MTNPPPRTAEQFLADAVARGTVSEPRPQGRRFVLVTATADGETRTIRMTPEQLPARAA